MLFKLFNLFKRKEEPVYKIVYLDWEEECTTVITRDAFSNFMLSLGCIGAEVKEITKIYENGLQEKIL